MFATEMVEAIAEHLDVPATHVADRHRLGRRAAADRPGHRRRRATRSSTPGARSRRTRSSSRSTARVGVPVPLRADEHHDLDAMAAAITTATRLVLVCNPNNPTGTRDPSRRARSRSSTRCPRDVLVVLDEAYREFVRDPEVPDGVELYRDRPNVCVLRTFSKAYGLAGLRVGYAIAHEPVAEALRKTAVPFGVSGLAQRAALASLDAEDELLARVDLLVSGAHRGRRRAARAGLDRRRRRRPTSSGSGSASAPPSSRPRAPRSGSSVRAVRRRGRARHHRRARRERRLPRRRRGLPLGLTSLAAPDRRPQGDVRQVTRAPSHSYGRSRRQLARRGHADGDGCTGDRMRREGAPRAVVLSARTCRIAVPASWSRSPSPGCSRRASCARPRRSRPIGGAPVLPPATAVVERRVLTATVTLRGTVDERPSGRRHRGRGRGWPGGRHRGAGAGGPARARRVRSSSRCPGGRWSCSTGAPRVPRPAHRRARS